MPKEEKGNFIFQCIQNTIIDESCLLGSSVLIISITLLVLNIYAFITMTKFYRKMNFENTIILLSIIQTLILQCVLITSYDLFFESFFLVQIFIISLIIRKFIILAIEPKTFFDKNGIFALLNALNIIIFFIYPLYLKIFKGHHLYVKLFYRIFHAMTTCILSYYCVFFIKLTVKFKHIYLKSYNFFYEPKISNNDNNIKNNNNLNNNEANNNNENNKNNSKHKSTKGKGEVFYHKKKKQIRYLYVVNLFCAFIEICFTITRNFILEGDYYKDDFKTIPKSTTGDIIYYIYLIVCFCNVSVNYLCFFFYIRHQYTKNTRKFIDRPEKILDDDYIKIEEKNKNINNTVNSFLFNSSAAVNKNEKPIAVEVKAEGRDSLNSDEFESDNNNALLPDEFSNKSNK